MSLSSYTLFIIKNKAKLMKYISKFNLKLFKSFKIGTNKKD